MLDRLGAPGIKTMDGIEALTHEGELPLDIDGEPARESPPDACLELWKRGHAQSWEGRIRLAPGLLRASRSDLLRRRIWMAQVSVFFPEIEMARSRLAVIVQAEATRGGFRERTKDQTASRCRSMRWRSGC